MLADVPLAATTSTRSAACANVVAGARECTGKRRRATRAAAVLNVLAAVAAFSVASPIPHVRADDTTPSAPRAQSAATPGPASEEPNEPPRELTPPPAQMSEFYRELRRPSARRAAVHHRLALGQLDTAPRAPGIAGGPVAEAAITRLRLARASAPDDPEILFDLGMLLSGEIGPRRRNGERRIDEAIEVLLSLRRLEPGYEPFLVGTELAVLYTRALDFEAATREYELAMGHALEPRAIGGVIANHAEVAMHAGDLTHAIELYERALALESAHARSSRGLALVLFGLAVALDRVGEDRPALERAAQAVTAAGGSLAILESAGVFYEPRHELAFYQGLGHLALAVRESSVTERIRHLEQARQGFARFLELGGRDGQFAETAVRRLAEAERLLREAAPVERRR